VNAPISSHSKGKDARGKDAPQQGRSTQRGVDVVESQERQRHDAVR